MFKRFLFPRPASSFGGSVVLLALRLLFGLLLMSHGYQKLSHFDAYWGGAFPDPLGLGSNVSLALSIFAEFLCPIAVVGGFLFRLALLPMLATMAVAFFFVHGGSVAEGELAFVNLMALLLLYAAGPGFYAADTLIADRLGLWKARRP